MIERGGGCYGVHIHRNGFVLFMMDSDPLISPVGRGFSKLRSLGVKSSLLASLCL